MRMTRIYWKRFKSPVALAAGALLGVAMSAASMAGVAFTSYKTELATIQALRSELEAMKQAESEELVTEPKLPVPAENLTIGGFMRVGPETRYRFNLVQGDSVRSLTSDDLRSMGIGVNKVHACEVVLTYRGSSTRVYCS